jgi:hypothetical protein
MSRVSKKKLLKILKGEGEEKYMSRSSLLDWLAKPVTQEQWLKEYRIWKKRQEKEIAKNKRTDS